MSPDQRENEEALRTLEHVRGLRDDFVELVSELCRVESPSDHPETQAEVHRILRPAFEDLGFEVEIIPGELSGDHLLARSPEGDGSRPTQLIMGHSDTVWPLGTLERMPVEVDGGRLKGPGTLDMKGGLTSVIMALRTLRSLGMEPSVAPVVFVNADEEVGSPDSKKHVRRLAGEVSRALVVEPPLGLDGRIKTARKGVGNFHITLQGRAAHAGLDPLSGASAIVELAHLIRKLDTLNDHQGGTTVNVGTVRGGTRPNVIAAEARAQVDVRVVTVEAGEELERRIRALKPENPDVSLRIEGGIRVPPLERTPRNRRLWKAATEAADAMGLELEEALAGGGSDGNTTSLYTATLDGLGCVGDGAHADHEHILIEPSLERCALLARLLMAPVEVGQGGAE
ncbi:MAG: M20 family metallopeptidase [Longimicrobiales bacterium]|nr:M20 family metallopeptidase [Longimicrobiales bacterium]